MDLLDETRRCDAPGGTERLLRPVNGKFEEKKNGLRRLDKEAYLLQQPPQSQRLHRPRNVFGAVFACHSLHHKRFQNN